MEVLDEERIAKSNPIIWRQFVLFTVVLFAWNLLAQFLAGGLNPGDSVFDLINVISIFEPFVWIVLFLKTIRLPLELSYRHRVVILIALLTIRLVVILGFNVLNIFDRETSTEILYNGALTTISHSLIVFVMSLPILWILKNKVQTDGD